MPGDLGEGVAVPSYDPETETRKQYWDRIFDYVTAVELDAEQKGFERQSNGLWSLVPRPMDLGR